MRAASLIVGGNGALGRHMVQAFKAGGSKVVSLDLGVNSEADVNILVNKSRPMKEQAALLLAESMKASHLYDSIICVAGGFNLSSVKDKDIFEKYEEIDKMNFQTALLAGHIASHQLNNKGFLCLTGAAAAFTGPVNYAYAYGCTKAATHALAQTLAQRTEIPADSCVITILPTMIDTEANREAMPDADKSEWVPPQKLAQYVNNWARGMYTPLNGSFVKIGYKNKTIIPVFL